MKWGRRSRGRWAVRVVTAALVAGCSSGPISAKGTATVPQSTTTTDPWAPPAVIDVPFLQRVMDRLDQSLGDALRELVTTKSQDVRYQTIIHALYGEPELSRTLADDSRGVASGLTTFRPAPGNPVTAVQTILSTSPTCVYFSAQRSFGAALLTAPPVAQTQGYVALRHAALSVAAQQINPTGYVLILDALRRPGETLKDPCA